MDNFYYEESDTKHIVFKCLVIIFIIGLCVGAFIFVKNKNTIKLKRVVVELGSELSTDVNDYLVNGKKFSSDYKLYLDDVNKNKVGTYEYKVRYNKHVKTGKIIVQDTILPEVTVGEINVGINEEVKAIYLVTSCKDISLPCSAVFEDNTILEKIKTPGEYETGIIVSDASGNSVTKSAKIISTKNGSFDSVMTNDLEYYINNINDNSLEEIFFEKLDNAINEDTLEYENLIQEISVLDFEALVSGEISDIQLVTAYNKYGYVIGIQVLVTYSDGSRELLTKEGE